MLRGRQFDVLLVEASGCGKRERKKLTRFLSGLSGARTIVRGTKGGKMRNKNLRNSQNRYLPPTKDYRERKGGENGS